MNTILFSITAVPRSGWGVLTYNHALALWQKKIPFRLLLPRSAERIDAPFSSCVKYILPDLPLTFSGMTAWRFLPRLYMPVRHTPSQGAIVHSLIDFPYAALAYRYARLHGLPFFMGAIGTYSVAPFRRFPDRYLFMPAYRNAERIIAISAYTKNHMIAAAGHLREVDVLHLPVMRPVPKGKEDFRIFSRLPAGKRYVVTVSSPRAHGRKGLSDMIEAFNRVVSSFPDIHLVAVGGSAATFSNYTVIPQVSAAELGALYERCILFAAMPFRTDNHFEGYGLVYREAGLYGKPVIGTCSGGVPEAIEDGMTGLLVPEHGIVEMAEALERLFSDKSLADRLGNTGYAHATARTWGGYVLELIRLYRNNHCK